MTSTIKKVYEEISRQINNNAFLKFVFCDAERIEIANLRARYRNSGTQCFLTRRRNVNQSSINVLVSNHLESIGRAFCYNGSFIRVTLCVGQEPVTLTRGLQMDRVDIEELIPEDRKRIKLIHFAPDDKGSRVMRAEENFMGIQILSDIGIYYEQ